MVDYFLDTMQIELAEYEVGKALVTLASVNQGDTSAKRGKDLTELLAKLIPEKVEGFIGLAHDIPNTQESQEFLLFDIKYELLNHIAEI